MGEGVRGLGGGGRGGTGNSFELTSDSLIRSIFCYFLQKIYGFSFFLRFFRFFFGLFRNNSVCFGCFDIGSKNRNKQK